MKVLVTGANGYVGSRLLPLLVEEGHEAVALVRSKNRFHLPEILKDKVTVLEGDLLKPETLDIPKEIDAAYYLVHSMAQSFKKFSELEELSARNFLAGIKETSVKQIIYLSGLIPETNLSPHMASRKKVEEILMQEGVSCTVLRAAIVIGSGGASFEIIRDLVEVLPVMVAPKWVENLCQPIAIYDVLRYLVGVLGNQDCFDQIFEVGGSERLTYKSMLYQYADIRGLRRWIFTVPVLTPKLSSYWLLFVTSTNFFLAMSLVESLKNEAICRDNRIQRIIPHKCMTYKEAVNQALEIIDQNMVVSSWKDALTHSRLNPELQQYLHVPTYGCLADEDKVPIQRDPEEVIENLWTIGGERGWYSMNWAWKFRGMVDKLFGGVGLKRGRRHPSELAVGDALDFWRVIAADKEKGHLLLYAEMKLPGEAWLEFKIQRESEPKYLIQKATFRPKGILGRFYWYILYPAHAWIFHRMARAIVRE